MRVDPNVERTGIVGVRERLLGPRPERGRLVEDVVERANLKNGEVGGSRRWSCVSRAQESGKTFDCVVEGFA